jgi:hypothetical protein
MFPSVGATAATCLGKFSNATVVAFIAAQADGWKKAARLKD